jgi:hypothetical protein
MTDHLERWVADKIHHEVLTHVGLTPAEINALQADAVQTFANEHIGWPEYADRIGGAWESYAKTLIAGERYRASLSGVGD